MVEIVWIPASLGNILKDIRLIS